MTSNLKTDSFFFKLFATGILRLLVKLSVRIREGVLRSTGFNVGLIPAELVYFDLFTDSLMHFVLPKRNFSWKNRIGYSAITLDDTFKRYFGFNHVITLAQGRMAEALLARILVRNATIIPSNGLFVTTRLHQELSGATVLEIPVKEAYEPESDFSFKGDLDINKLEEVIDEYGHSWIPFIYVETCVNATGGHPVSMRNLKEVSHLAKTHHIPVILDACRILENAYLIKEKEEGYSHKTIAEIVKEFCSYTDGCTMSASKDFFVDTGAFFATNDQKIYYEAQDAIMVFGDGLSVRAKAELNKVLRETFQNESVVHQRVRKVRYLWMRLKNFGLPVFSPCGGHAVFLDSRQLYDLVPEELNPEKAFLAELYISSGVRGGENILTPLQKKSGVKMLRFAVPTQTYSLAQMDYIARSINSVWKNKNQIKGLRKIYQPPSLGGSFFAKYELVKN